MSSELDSGASPSLIARFRHRALALSSMSRRLRLVTALAVSQVLVAAILLALMWELTVSAESITNGHSAAVPRATRVLLFCGYIMLVATTVLFFSTLHLQASGAAVEPQFESETWPALGILQLGVPALLCLVGLRLGLFSRRALRSR